MNSEEKLLQKLIGLFFFATSLAGIFLNLFLFQLGGFRAVISYGLISLVFLFIIYFFSGYILNESKKASETSTLYFSKGLRML